MKKSELFFSAVLVPVDYGMILLAGFLAYQLRFYSFVTDIRPVFFELDFSGYFKLIIFVPLLFLMIFSLTGLYSVKNTRRIIDEMAKTFVAVTAGIAFVIVIIFFQRELFSSRFIVLIGWALAVLLVMIGRLVVRIIQHVLLRRGIGVHSIIIIGNDQTTDEISKHVYQDQSLGYKIVARYHEFNDETRKELVEKCSTSFVDEIIQTDPNLPKDMSMSLREFSADNHVVFKYATDLFDVQPTHIEINPIAGIPIIEVKRTQLDGWGKIFKRFFDILFSLLSLIILAPVFLLTSLMIIIDSQGGVFVKLPRIGEKGKKFTLYKFRSMIKNAHLLKGELLKMNERSDGPLFKIKNDPRITRVGRFIRKTSIDELPQFFNVLKGDMSMVGPRPHEPEEVNRYERWHRKLLTIKPGATGLAQVSGRSELKFEDEAKLDIYYIENWTPSIDLQVLLKTPWVVVKGNTAS
jgi:exopolysaccharide biosynthesis polyprenyl glycosylphosphotransferase